MKKYISVLLALITVCAVTACRNQKDPPPESSAPPDGGNPPLTEPNGSESAETESGNILIAYFSLGNNAEYPDDIDAATSASLILDGEELIGTTEYVARLIKDNVGGDLHSIETAEPYPADFDAVVDQNHEETDAEILPELTETNLDIAQYDTIFIGYPVWATGAPRAVFSFLSLYDLSGKTIIPFCTHDGYGAGGSYKDIADAVDGETAVLDGLAIEAPDVPEAADTVAGWLRDIGVKVRTDASAQAEETAITVTVGGKVLDGVLYDNALADEIREYFPLTISMVGFGGREYYGGVDFYPENTEGGQKTFENGHITYCEAHHNMAIFYAQTDDPVLSVDVIPIGMVTSDLKIFDELPDNAEVTFELAE